MTVVVIMFIIGVGLLTLGMHGRIFAIQTGAEITARCAADAGLTDALAAMNQKKNVLPWDDSILPSVTGETLPYCNATYDYAVTGDLDTGYSVQAIGYHASGPRREVNATLRVRGLFDYGIVVKETVTLHTSVLVDGYDSSDAARTDVPVQVATVNPNPSSVVLKSGAMVDGEVLHGVDFDFPIVDPPALNAVDTELFAQGSTLKIGPADSGRYSGIRLLQNQSDSNTVVPAELEIEGGDVVLHVTGDIWLGNSCEVTIAPDSSLTMYLNGDMVMCNSSSFNNQTQIPSNLALYGIGAEQHLEIKAKSDWFGVIYAPNADIDIKAMGDVYGSFVATSLDNRAASFVWYDAALSDVDLGTIGSRFTIERWYEK
jgi:hypothetical protein